MLCPQVAAPLSEMPQNDELQTVLWANDWLFEGASGYGDNFGGTALLEAPVRSATTFKIPIEDVPLGARIPTKNPRPWEYHDSLPEPDEATWSKISITAERKDGQIVDAELIRPTAWVEAQDIQAGQLLPLHIEELQMEGLAHVTALEACPPIAAGEGSVVTARFITRQVDEVATIEVIGPDGQIESLTGTKIHPIWSVDRQDWVPLSELREGETLQVAAGLATVISVSLASSARPVYNIEVHGEHVYEVGEVGVLVHNVYPDAVTMRRIMEHPRADALLRGIKEINRTFVDELDELKHLDEMLGEDVVGAGIRAKQRYWDEIKELLDLPDDMLPPVDF